MRLSLVLALAAAGALAGCQYPRDVEGTLDRVTDGEMRVGVSDNEPWVNLDGQEPSGVEPTIIPRFAATIDAEIHWVQATARSWSRRWRPVSSTWCSDEVRRDVGLTEEDVSREGAQARSEP